MTNTGIASPSVPKSRFFLPRCQTSRPLLAVFFLVYLFAAGGLSAQTAFKRGEELFLRNMPREAAPLLETALIEEPRNEKIYLYLGIAYEQLANNDKAIALLTKGLEYAIVYKDLLYFNLGNNYFTKGEGEKAAEMYSRAIETNGSLSDAYLNRANAGVRLERFDDAVRDYKLYLTMEPDTPQRPQIERMIRLIEGLRAERAARLLEEEKRKKEEEENRRIAEERRKQEEARLAAEEEKRRREEEENLRLAAERKKQEEDRRRRQEEARQKALLEEVLRSLQAASEGTTNLSAEKEDIREKREDADIED